ncbi:hypothetical protein Pcinc_008292 [Petrolisthes cinctipes]|uniref:Ion transport domain-containing protein n=1 Tax=Petrolisthes cinctipes TaxID=88211 RepID=A0AAE1KXD9_PETCI|nr:hypothetical protein Pcinc_008292 [Petrolisthes cinctipes]
MKRLWNVLVRKKGRSLSRRVEEGSSEVKREEDGECPGCSNNIEMEEENITTQNASDIVDDASPSLFQAIQDGDLETVRAGANQLDPQGVTPLHRAVTREWSEGVAVLLHCGASPNTYSTGHEEKKETPFHTAIRVGNIQAAEMMLDFLPNLKAVDGGGNTVLHLAAYKHHTAILYRLLRQEPCLQAIHSLSVKGSSVLHAALDKTHKNVQEEKVMEILQIFIELGVNVNLENHLGQTALYLAVYLRLPKCSELLMKHGANPLTLTRKGQSLVHAACQNGCAVCLQLLLDTGIVSSLILKQDKRLLAPFHYAVNSSSIDCCEILLKNGDHLTHVDSEGESRISLLIEYLPTASHLLTKLFDSHITLSQKPHCDPDFSINFDYSKILTPPERDIQSSLLKVSIIGHPSKCLKNWETLTKMCSLITSAFVVFTPLYLNNYGTIQQPQEEPATATTITTPQHHQRLPLQPYMRTIAALSVFFGWTELMMLFGRLPILGTSVLMFTSIAKSALKFMTAFSGLLVGFATGFLVLFHENPFFGTFGKALVKTLMMMIGEVSYTELVVDQNTAFITYLLLVAFLFFVCILMVNLLIGLAVDDISKLQNTGRIAKLSKQASYIVTIEKILRGAHKYRLLLRFMMVKILTKHIMACPEKRVYTNKKKSRKTKWEEYNHNIATDTLQRAKEIAKANLNGNDGGSSEEINMKALHGKMERLDHRLSQLIAFLKSEREPECRKGSLNVLE